MCRVDDSLILPAMRHIAQCCCIFAKSRSTHSRPTADAVEVSELAVRKHRGYSGVKPASSVRVRAVDSARSPKRIAETTLRKWVSALNYLDEILFRDTAVVIVTIVAKSCSKLT